MSALWEYMDPSVAMLVPGARKMHGWCTPTFGQLGDSPIPANLEVLARLTPCFTVAELEPMIDHVFALHDASPPMFRLEATLRQGW